MQKIIRSTAFASILSVTSLFSANYLVESIEKSVVANSGGTYNITGYFSSYTFGNDAKSNWTFTFYPDGPTYQLLGDTSEDNIKKMGVFGWVKRDVNPKEPMYYMVQYENTPFGWLLFDIDENGYCKNIFKLAGQDPNNKSFCYDVDGDGSRDILSNLSCRVSGDSVKFYFTNIDETTPPALPVIDNMQEQSIYIGEYVGTYNLTGGTKANTPSYCKTSGSAILNIDNNLEITGTIDTGLDLSGVFIDTDKIYVTAGDGTKIYAIAGNDKITGTYNFNDECSGSIVFIKQ